MHRFNYEYTDTFAGDANYCRVKSGAVTVPELTHYGYDGALGYTKADKAQHRALVTLVKAELGLTGVRCDTHNHGDMTEIRPRGLATICFITFDDSDI